MRRDSVATLQEDRHDVRQCREELAAFQSLLNSSLDVICSVDKNGRFLYVSEAALRVWGYAPSDLIGCRYIDLVLPDDRLKTEAIAATISMGIDVTSFSNRYIKKDGSIVPVLWSARWSEHEQVIYAVAKDATEIQKSVEQHRLFTRRLQSAYKLANIAWWEFDVASQTFTWSDEIFHMYDMPVPIDNQNTLTDFLALVHPDDRPQLEQDLATITEVSYSHYEHRIIKPTGDIIYVTHHSEIIRDNNGMPVAIYGTTKDITTQKISQLKLEESEKRLQQYSRRLSDILESIGDGFFAVDRNWTVTYWNRQAEELLGKNERHMVGSNFWSHHREAISETFYAECHRAMEDHVVVQFEEKVKPFNLWLEVAVYPSAEGLSVYFKNVTEKKWQQQALQLANERFELASRASSDAIWDWDVLTNTCYFNDAFTHLFGHENKEDLVYRNWVDNIHEADRQQILESLSEAMNNPAVKQWEHGYRFYRCDRTLAFVLDRGHIIRNEQGQALRMVGSMQDISNLKATEAEMKKLSLVATETVNAVVITDADENITWVNKAFTDSTGYTFEEACGKKPSQLLQGPGTSLRTKNYLRKCIAKRQPFNCEILNYTKSGHRYWVEIKGQPIFDENGELQQFFAIQTDITNRKETEDIIRLSEEKYKLLFHGSPRPKWIFHADTHRIVDVNQAAISLYGYNRNEFLRLKVQDLRVPEEQPELSSFIESLKKKTGGHFQKVVRHRKKSGEVFYIDICSFTIQLPSGTHFIVGGMDMTEKLQLQQQLITEKVNAQKEIARAIIHGQERERSAIGKELHDNVCQLLTTAKLYMENIKHMPEQQETFMQKGIELVLTSINEIRYLSRQLVSPLSVDVDFETAVNELLNHYRSMNLFEIHFDYQATVELVDKDLKTSIIRILQEQLNNTVKYAKASSVQFTISNTLDTLLLRYEDNGVGFDPASVKNGIGLMNVKNRAGAYKGSVTLTTGVGKGCCIEITFPLVEEIVD